MMMIMNYLQKYLVRDASAVAVSLSLIIVIVCWHVDVTIVDELLYVVIVVRRYYSFYSMWCDVMWY